jgi:serine protease Do
MINVMARRIVEFYAGICVVVGYVERNTFVPTGTGFGIDEVGHILTCAHCLRIDRETVIFAFGISDEYKYEDVDRRVREGQAGFSRANICQYDGRSDCALLKAADLSTNINCIDKLQSGNAVHVGESIVYMGYPFCNRGLYSQKFGFSLVGSKLIDSRGNKKFQIDASAHESISGGPVIDIGTGRIIGMISGRFSPTGPNKLISVGDYGLGQESTISFCATMDSSIDLLKAEGIYV